MSLGLENRGANQGSHCRSPRLVRYASSHPFAASLSGSDNIIAFHTSRYSARPLIVQGSGAGADVTAMGVVADIIKVSFREKPTGAGNGHKEQGLCHSHTFMITGC